MKPLYLLGSALLAMLISSCALHPKPVALQTVGPAPTAKSEFGNEGYLVVYSAWSAFVNPDECNHHSRYWLASDNGSSKKEVLNHADRFDTGPIRLSLKPGSYRVTARAIHSQLVDVPVVIKERQTTFVYLDGMSHPSAPARTGSQVVKLPDGEIAGWSAQRASE
jgi:hypothetical protein